MPQGSEAVYSHFLSRYAMGATATWDNKSRFSTTIVYG